MPALPPPEIMAELIKNGTIPPPPPPELLAELIKNGTLTPPTPASEKTMI